MGGNLFSALDPSLSENVEKEILKIFQSDGGPTDPDLVKEVFRVIAQSSELFNLHVCDEPFSSHKRQRIKRCVV